MTDRPEQVNFAAWLGDADQKMEPQDLLEALDALFAACPGEETALQAQARLQQFLASMEGGVYYDSFHHPLTGETFVAVGERGLVAVNFGVPERDFIRQVEYFGSPRRRLRDRRAVVRSPEKAAGAVHQVKEYLDGTRTRFELPVDLSALTEFQRQVLLAARQVPRGQVATYAEIARRVGRPRAARAVGQALGRNPLPIVIPCHRVIASNGSLCGYSGGGGVRTKAKLLALEGASLV